MTNNLSFMMRLVTGNPKPEVVSVNLTQACNQRCRYCEIGNNKVRPDKPLLTITDLKWIIDQMVRSKIPLLSIGGGEPLLVHWLWDVLTYAKKRGIKTELVTNGMMINDLSKQRLDDLRSTYNISVSIDTMNPHGEDFLRGVKGALLRQFESIRKLHQEKIPFSIATVISEVNYLDLEELVTTMDVYGARFIKFQPVWTGTNFPGTPAVNKSSLVIQKENIPVLVSILKEVVEFEETHKIKTNAGELLKWISLYLEKTTSVPFYQSFVNKYWCHSLHAIITINYFGEILPCNYLPATVDIHHRNEPITLMELWNVACSEARMVLNEGSHFPECALCTNSLDISVICSGIKHPISNFNVLPKLGKMVIQKIRKQRAMKKGRV